MNNQHHPLNRQFPKRANLKAGNALIPQLIELARDLEITTEDLSAFLEVRFGLVQTAFDRLPFLTTREMEQLAHEFGVSVQTIEETTAAYFSSRIGTSQDSELQELLVPFTKRLKVCPKCLQEKQNYQLSWQVSWSFVCTRHHVLLQDICPHCEYPIASKRRTTGIPVEHFRCGNHIVNQSVCHERLDQLPRVSVANYPAILKAQNILEAVINGKSVLIFNQTVVPKVFLQNCIALLKILWGFIVPEQLASAPIKCTGAYHQFTRAREKYFQYLEQENPLEDSPAAISRLWGTLDLMTGTMPLVLEILALSSRQAMVNRLIALIQQSCYQRPQYPLWILQHFERQAIENHHWMYTIKELQNWLRRTYFLRKEVVAHVPNPYPL